MAKFLVGVVGALALLVAPVVGASPMTTVLHRGKPIVPDEATAKAVVMGFAACDPISILPPALFGQAGAVFLSHETAAAIRFPGKGLRDRDLIRLAGGVTARDDNGRAVRWEATWPLHRPVRLAPGVDVVAVGQGVSFEPGPRPEISVTLTFRQPLEAVRPKLEALVGKPLRDALDVSRPNPAAVGFAFDESLGLQGTRSFACVRLPE